MKCFVATLSLLLIVSSTQAVSPTNMVFVKGGTFKMGDTWGDGKANQRPVHLVTLDSFEISESEVTLGEVARVLNWAYKNGKILIEKKVVKSNEINPKDILLTYDFQWDGKQLSPKGSPNLPCRFISWYGATLYCNYRSEMDGLAPCYDEESSTSRWVCDFSKNGYRLPTEAEWEYSARGGALSRNRKYSGSAVLDLVGWCQNNNGKMVTTSQERKRNSDYDGSNEEWTLFTHTEVTSLAKVYPVGTKPPNELKLFDMSGNVAEWCYDWYGDYEVGPQTNPKNPTESMMSDNREKVLRGGSYLSESKDCRVDSRTGSPPDEMIAGFRVARSVLSKENVTK
jgi:sulfatase modifying factor 1